MDIEIQGLTKQQMLIADMLWKSVTMDDVNHIIQQYGTEAETIKELILYACIDDSVASIQDCKKATELLTKLFNH